MIRTNGIEARTLAIAILEEPAAMRARLTVADQVDHHIAHLTGVTEGTRRRYQKLADTQLRPAFGDKAAADLTRDDVAAWVNELTWRPNAPGPQDDPQLAWSAVLGAVDGRA